MRSLVFFALFAIPFTALAVTAACDDVTSYDVEIPDEAGIEGGLGVVDDGSGGSVDRFCLHTDAGLCADFDGPNLGEWASSTNQTTPTTVPLGADLEVGDGPTGKDMVATLPAGADVANIAKGFVHAGTEAFRAEADMYVKQPGASWVDQPVGIVSVVYGTNGFTATVTLAGVDATDGKLGLALGSGSATVKGNAVVPYETWFHVALSVDPTAQSASLATSTGLTITSTATTASAAPSPAQLTLFVGVKREAPTVTPTALVLQADNIVGYVE